LPCLNARPSATLFPSPTLFRARGRAVGIANMIGKGGSVVGTLSLPTLYDSIGNLIFVLIAVAALVNLVVVAIIAPETKGRTLDRSEERRVGKECGCRGDQRVMH